MGQAFIHSFAKVWLDKLGNEIYINDTNFFEQDLDKLRDKFVIAPLRTGLYIGDSLINEEELEDIKYLPFEDMKKKLGLTIYKLPVEKKGWRKLQKDILIIGKKRPGVPNEIPNSTFTRRALKIEWNRAECWVRGVGENFGTDKGQYAGGDITPEIYYAEGKKDSHNINPVFKMDSFYDVTKDWYKVRRGEEVDSSERINIKELPVLISEDGLLLCMPKTKVLPKIIAVGKTRGGKSFALNSIMGRAFYMFQDRVGLVNDSLNQFYDLSLAQNQVAFIKEIGRVDNEPRHLPTINLYMSCPSLKMNYKDEHVSYRLVISFKTFLKSWDYFAQGVDKWKIGAPFKYVSKEIINEMSQMKTTAEIRNYLFAKFSEMQGDGKELEKGKREMLMKWVASIDKVLADKFTDNLFQDEETTAAQWKLVRENGNEVVGHPFIIALEAGLVPVINNYLAKTKPIAIKQMADLLNKVVEHQMHVDKKKRIWMFIDELKDFLKHRKGNVLYTALDEIFTQGAFNNIGFAGSIQEYSKLTNSMRNNLSHIIIFDMPSKEERRKVADDLELDKDRMEELYNLGKHQCLFATKESVVIYNREGQRKVVEGGIWKGKVIPPITHHKDTGE